MLNMLHLWLRDNVWLLEQQPERKQVSVTQAFHVTLWVMLRAYFTRDIIVVYHYSVYTNILFK